MLDKLVDFFTCSSHGQRITGYGSGVQQTGRVSVHYFSAATRKPCGKKIGGTRRTPGDATPWGIPAKVLPGALWFFAVKLLSTVPRALAKRNQNFLLTNCFIYICIAYSNNRFFINQRKRGTG